MRDFKDYYNDIIRDISALVQIPTVYDAATVTQQMPYGKNVYQGYQWLKEKALKDGFEVIEYDGHALAIRIRETSSKEGYSGAGLDKATSGMEENCSEVCFQQGSGEDNNGIETYGKEISDHEASPRSRIDVVSHVDVVAPGGGWREDPYSGSITDEYIYGRGTMDMKGSLILTYYALKYIRDNNIPCRKELRVVIGCDEERTMGDIRYYISKAGEPDFAFTPDGRLPFSLGEKGALMWTLEGSMDSIIESLKGGVQCNVISPIAQARVKDPEKLTIYQDMLSVLQYNGTVVKEADYIEISIYGKQAHASIPELGCNATVRLLELIYKVSQDRLAGILYHCFADPYGQGAEIAYDIAPMGKLTLNLGILNIKDSHVDAQIDCRYPLGVTSKELTEKLQQILEPIKVNLKYDDGPTIANEDLPYPGILLDTYREVTGDKVSVPFISGGVTYSKVIGNCVAFGPIGKDDIPLAHQANELIELSRVKMLFELYTKAMIKLAGL